MQKLWEHYHTPHTVDEAAALLTQYAGKARIIAGGTDLLVDMRADPHSQPHHALVDITAIPDLCSITQQHDYVHIGAGVTHTKIVKSPLVIQGATCLVESCGVVGGPQVRNVATLGGNVAHALPAGDGTTSLVALDADVEVIHNGERKWVHILEMFLGAGQSLLDSSRDLLLQFRFKLAQENEGTAFKRIMRPQGVALPVLGCAVWVKLDETKTHYADIRVCIAPVGPIPQRIIAVEDVLKGQPANESTLLQAVEIAHRTIKPRTSKYRATAEYRREMVEVLLRRTVPLAVNRATTGESVPEGVGV